MPPAATLCSRVRFEFDPAKSAANKTKHGVDLVEGQALWADVNRLEIPARTSGGPRFATLGILRGEVWMAIWTPRGEGVRLISIRRATPKESHLYEG